MHKYFYIPAVILAVFSASCASTDQTKTFRQNEVVVRDESINKKGEIVIDGRDTEAVKSPLLTSRPSSKEALKTALDGSRIETMLDAFGNKTEIRTFSGNFLVQTIIARSFADGRRQIFVYGQNGEARNLPVELYEKFLTAPGESLANAAGIFMGRKPRFAFDAEENAESRTILPAPTFPVLKAQAETEKPQNAEIFAINDEAQSKTPTMSVKTIGTDLQNLDLKTPQKKSKAEEEKKTERLALNVKNVAP